MKTLKFTFFVFCAFVLMSFTINSVLAWQSDNINVGEIPQGKPKSIEFQFKNEGKSEILITAVRASCGCTASDYTKEAIAPGKTGIVKAIYNAAALGSFTKTVTVTTTAEETPKVLTFSGLVK